MERWFFPQDGSTLDEVLIKGGAYYAGDVGWQFEVVLAAGYTHPTLSNARGVDITSSGFKPAVDYSFS